MAQQATLQAAVRTSTGKGAARSLRREGKVPGVIYGHDRAAESVAIDTAGTMAEAVTALKRLGARDIYCCATHALLSGPAVDRLMASPVKEVTVTNTIAIPPERRFDRLKVLSIAGLLAKAIGYTHSDQSVSSLFD